MYSEGLQRSPLGNSKPCCPFGHEGLHRVHSGFCLAVSPQDSRFAGWAIFLAPGFGQAEFSTPIYLRFSPNVFVLFLRRTKAKNLQYIANVVPERDRYRLNLLYLVRYFLYVYTSDSSKQLRIIGGRKLIRFHKETMRSTILSVGCLLAAHTANAALIIDQFTITQTVNAPNATATGQVSDSLADTFLGADREVLVQRTQASAKIVAGSGQLEFTTGHTGRAEILYDGASANPVSALFGATPDSFGLGLNLTNYDRFQVTAGTDNSSVPLTIVLFQSGTKYLTGNITLNTAALGTQSSSTLLFSNFVATGDTVTNILQSVGAISVRLNGGYSNTSGGDVRLTSLSFLEVPPPTSTVPEPGTMSIVGLGCAAVATFVRKRKA